MLLTFTKTLLNNVYTVVVTTTDFDTLDLALFTEFGEPSVNIGGDMIDVTDGTTKLATLPNNFRKVKSGLPFTMNFSDTQYLGKGMDVANAWIETMNTSITNAVVALRAKSDTFTGIQDFTI